MEEISFDDVEEVINNFQGLNKTMHYMMMEKQKSLIYHRIKQGYYLCCRIIKTLIKMLSKEVKYY